MQQQFISNQTELSFLDKIIDSLRQCKKFYFSVSFIKMAGLKLLIPDLEAALKRGVEGKLVTSTYQNFTDIASLRYFLSLQERFTNFECHLDHRQFKNRGFHTKGYFFEYCDHWEIVIGSTNITYFALKRNIEWNMSAVTKQHYHLLEVALNEFRIIWDKTLPLTHQLIKDYQEVLNYAIEKWDMDYFDDFRTVEPNVMQRKALKELRRYRDLGVNRALVIAATGSGKTHLAAFDARNFGAEKLLFIVHRDTILKDAQRIFQQVFGETRTYGFFTGNEKSFEVDFLFSTNTSMSRNLEQFTTDAFDYIVIDEVHHAVADTYRKTIDYFKPQFLLGLTATPERMDGESVFDLFEKNVPFELRLRDALLNDLIVPFKYYGIRDRHVDYSRKSMRTLGKQLASMEHCELISEHIEKYRPNGKLKAIGFCQNIDHASQMAESMQAMGYHTTYLTGDSRTGERIKAFRDLQDDDESLEIIFAVDLLNEGVDIPGINMVLFLRPTESSTIFIQQLGRGLRKYPDKEYLTVLDFIGNSYERSVQIAFALGTLSNSTSIEKPFLKDLIRDDFKALGLPVEIYIDEWSKEEILHYIDQTNFNRKEFLFQDYRNFKAFIQSKTYPKHVDYLNYEGAPDLIRFIKSRIDGRKNNSYYNFLLKFGEDVPIFSHEQIAFIDYLSNFLPLIRPDEFLIIRYLLIEDGQTLDALTECRQEEIYRFKYDQWMHALLNLQNNFLSENDKATLPQYVVNVEGRFHLIIDRSHPLFIEHIEDLLEYGLLRYRHEFGDGDFEGSFKLYRNYSTEQFMMALCERSLAYYRGTKLSVDGTVYILAGLKKDQSLDEHLKYRDKFLSPKVFQWESQTGTTLSNKHGRDLMNSKIAYLFIRKVKEEDGITLPYTYIGTGRLTNPRVSDNPKHTLLFDIVLDEEIPKHLRYEFKVPEDEIETNK